MTFRKRIEQSALVAGALGWLMACYLRLCNRTTRWTKIGYDDLQQALAQGPVVLVLWHECSLMAPVHWPVRHGQLSSLRDTSPIGMVSGAVQAAFGLDPMAMSPKMSNRAASREILRRVQAGKSIGLTGDGPLGPVGQVKDAALDWARATGCPVFVYTFAVKRHRRLKTWDRMILPLPFTSGVSLYQRWQAQVPRRADPATVDQLRTELKGLLDHATALAKARL